MGSRRLAIWGVVAAMAVATGGTAAAGPGDMTVELVGTEAAGEAVSATCELRPVSPPSNTFTGDCDVTVGSERLSISGLDASGQPLLSVVLNGRITIRGVAEAGSGRFQQLVSDGLGGFPVYLHIDPFGRAWGLERDVPAGGTEAVAQGRISRGSVVLGIQ